MSTLLDSFENGYTRFNRLLAGLVAISIGLFAVLIPLNLFLILVQWGSLPGLYEAVEYTLYFGVFLGAPWVLQQGAHVRVDVFVLTLSEQWAVRLDRALNVAGAILCVVLCIYGTRSALNEFASGILPDKDLRIPTGYMMVVFSTAFLLLTIEFLLRLRKERTISAKSGALSETGF